MQSMERWFMMGTNAYHIVTDLHDSNKEKENRFDYPGEINDVKEQIVRVGFNSREQGYTPILILLGDVFDNSFQDPDSATIANNFWILAKRLFKEIYVVVGNHETTYYKANPFYTLISEIKSAKVRGIVNKVWTPKGLANTFNVVDVVEDGDVVFHFNHHGTPISRPTNGKTNIALYHQDIVCKELIEAMRNQYGTDIFDTGTLEFSHTDLFDGFVYNFFGHMHKIYGTWEFVNEKTMAKSMLCYLGSLGRPNVTEVDNKFLERNIPVVLVEDGKLVGVLDNKFQLRSRTVCVQEAVVEKNKVKYEEMKILKRERAYVPVGDDPMENLVQRCITDGLCSEVLSGLRKFDIDPIGAELQSKIRKVIGVY